MRAEPRLLVSFAEAERGVAPDRTVEVPRRDAPQPVGEERVRAKVKHSSAARPAEAMALAIGTAVPSASRPTAMP